MPHVGFQGVFTASTASLDDVEVLLLASSDAKLSSADNGRITLSRRVVSVGHNKTYRLKVSIMTRCDEGDERAAARDDIVFVPKKDGRNCGMHNIGTWKMQVNVAWSLFDC